MAQLWVGNTDFWEKEERLMSVIEELTGISVKSCWFVRDRGNGRNQHYGFVEFASINDAAYVLNKLKGAPVPRTTGVRFNLNWGSNKPQDRGQNQEPAQRNESFSCYVGNLPLTLTDAKLLEFFKGYFPSVMSARIICMNDVSKGYGFVKFSSHNEVIEAIHRLNNTPAFGDKRIKVSEASQNYIKGAESKPIDYTNTTLFVSDIDPLVVNEDILLRHFRAYGRVVSVRIEPNHPTWATVKMESHTDAESAKNALQGSKFGGTTKALINWGKNVENSDAERKDETVVVPVMKQDNSAKKAQMDFFNEQNVDKIVNIMRDNSESQRNHPVTDYSYVLSNRKLELHSKREQTIFGSNYFSGSIPEPTNYWYF